MNMSDCDAWTPASSGKVNPAASKVILLLSTWQLRGDEDTAVNAEACSAHPIAGKDRKILWNPSLLAGQYTPGSFPPFLECPQHYIIPARDQYSALLCLGVFSEFPTDWDFMLFHYKTFSGVSLAAVNVVKFKVSIVLLSLSLGSPRANRSPLLATRTKGRETRMVGGKCVRSCPPVCRVQNWFKAPGHRKRTALHSRHVPVSSSRGSTIAIEWPRLQTPKWVCFVLQWSTWRSATCSTFQALDRLSCCCFIFLALLRLCVFWTPALGVASALYFSFLVRVISLQLSTILTISAVQKLWVAPMQKYWLV